MYNKRPEIRIGNDFIVEWSLFHDREHTVPYDLGGKDITVVISRFGNSFIPNFFTQGNVIKFTFYGVDQEAYGAGNYTATYFENRGNAGQVAVDKIEFVHLINRAESVISGSQDIAGASSQMHIDVISLSSDIDSVVNGLSAYELALQEGFVGTLSEWIDSLKGKPGDKGDKGDSGNINYPTFHVDRATMKLIMHCDAASDRDRFSLNNGKLILHI